MPAPRRRLRSALALDEKGSDNSLTLNPLILLRRTQMGRIDHKFRQRAAEAAMNIFGHVHAMRGTEQIKISSVVPVTHNGKPVEQRNVMLLGDHTHTI